MPPLRAVRLLVAQVALTLAFLAAWELSVALGWADPFFASRPTRVFGSLARGVTSGALFLHVGITTLEMLLGLGLGAALGIASGFLLGRYPSLYALLDPFLYALHGLPRVALAPLFILWFGIGLASKVAVSLSLVYFVCLFATYGGVRSTDEALMHAVKVLGATDMQVTRKVILPASLPWIFAGLKMSVGLALVGAIVGEFIGARAGLGFYIGHSASMFDTAGVFAGIFALAALAVLLNELINVVERRFLRWRPSPTTP